MRLYHENCQVEKPEKELLDLILIDGAAGHMIPRQTDKLEKLGDTVRHYFDEDDKPQAFSITLPNGQARHFEVLHSEEMPRLGFRAIAYREVEAIEDGIPANPLLQDGRAKLYFDFQGTKDPKDAATLAKIAARRPVTRHDQTEAFVGTAIEKAGSAEAVSQVISGGHSHGATKALTSYFIAERFGINDIQVLLTEPAGAHSTLNALAEDFAQTTGGKEEAIRKISESTMSVVSGPDLTLISKAAGGTVGKTYQLNTHETAFDEQEDVGRFKDKMNRRMDSHAQDRMMKAVLNGAEAEYIGRDIPRKKLAQSIIWPEGEGPSRRTALKAGGFVALGAVTADFGLGTVANGKPSLSTNSYNPPPLPGYSVATPNIPGMDDSLTTPGTFPSVLKLVENPTDRVSLAIQGILDLADSGESLDTAIKEKKNPPFEYTENSYSQAYKASGEIRGSLYDLRIFDPAKYDERTYEAEKHDPDNYLHFRKVAHHENPHTGDKAIALLHPETGTLVISTAGFRNEGLNRPLGIFSGDAARTVNPEFAEQFLEELSDQITAQHLQPRNVLISSHSIGVANGILMQAQIRSSPTLQRQFGGVPHMVALEGFGESLAADAVAATHDIPRSQIGAGISSVRISGPATDEGHEYDYNKAVGHQRHAISNIGDTEDPHRSDVISDWLTTGRSEVMPTQRPFLRPADMRKEKALYNTIGEAVELGRKARDLIGL